MKTNTYDRITKARAALVLDQPFFGSLALKLITQPRDDVATMATDGRHLWFNPAFADGLSMPQLRGVLAHEVMHCALRHHTRIGERDPDVWNTAGDHVINLILTDSDMELPDGALCDRQYAGMSTEAVYALLNKPQTGDQAQDEQPGTGDGGDGEERAQGAGQDDGDDDGESSQGGAQGDDGEEQGEGSGSGGNDDNGLPDGATAPDPGGCGIVVAAQAEDGGPASAAETADQDREWQIAIAQAAQQAEAMGALPGALRELVDDMLEPCVDWRDTLRDFLSQLARNDYAWHRPSRRTITQGMYLPGMHSEDMGDVVLAVDTSGSVSGALLAQFSGEINAIMEDVKPRRVHVVYCDATVNGHDEYEADDLPFQLDAKGRGGTLFQPVFDLVESLDEQPEAIVYFTDMGAGDLELLRDPGVPVLWADYCGQYMASMERMGRDVPFGTHMYVEG